jgi:hypothetical protein
MTHPERHLRQRRGGRPKRICDSSQGGYLLADLAHREHQGTAQLGDVDRSRHLAGQRAHGHQVFRPISVALVVLHLQQAQYLLAEANGVDHQAEHVGHDIGNPRVLPHIANDDRLAALEHFLPEGGERGGGIFPVLSPGNAAVRQRDPRGGDAVDPEVAPIEEPVSQALNLGEGTQQGRVAGDGRLHQVHLVEVLCPDGLVQNMPGEKSHHPERKRHSHPANGGHVGKGPDRQRSRHDRQQVRADFPAQNQDLFGALQLVSNQQTEVEEGPGKKEVERHQDGGGG